jgi:hypothetical protein
VSRTEYFREFKRRKRVVDIPAAGTLAHEGCGHATSGLPEPVYDASGLPPLPDFPSPGGPYRTGAGKSPVSNPFNVGEAHWRIDGPGGAFLIVEGASREALAARAAWLEKLRGK